MPLSSTQALQESTEERRSPELLTLICVAAAASALAGIAREVIGHAIAAQLAGAGWVATLAQADTPGRLVGVCGTLANLVSGGIAALLLRLSTRLTARYYFWWVFGCVSLMNSGRLLFSALFDVGDWSAVISTLQPMWLWRILLAAAGVFIYRPAVRFAVGTVRQLVERGELAYRDAWRLVLTAYLAAGLLFSAAGFLSPVNGSFGRAGGAGAAFGLNIGMLLAPAFLSTPADPQATSTRTMPFSWFWPVFALVICAAFLIGLGRAISF